MTKASTIKINGVTYDSHTGMRIADTPSSNETSGAKKERAPVDSHHIHVAQSRSEVLRRSHKASPHKKTVNQTAQEKVATSPLVKKFAPNNSSHAVKRHASQKIISDVGPIQHPVVVAAQKKRASLLRHSSAVIPKTIEKKPTTQPLNHPTVSSAEKKNTEISKAIRNATPAKKEKIPFRQRHARLMSAGSAAAAVVLLAGYFTYINLPNISVRIAGAQAGIAATYPSYNPSGYSLNGPVAYTDGEVSMKFTANAGPQEFTVKQSNSSWDSSALLANYVDEKSSGDYQTYNDNGLTIYIFGDDAAWVNGGVLHTIDGDAQLSPDQIRKIATSM